MTLYSFTQHKRQKYAAKVFATASLYFMFLACFVFVAVFGAVFSETPHVAHAQPQTIEYETLVPLPGIGWDPSVTPGQDNRVRSLPEYVNGMFRLLIGVAAGLAVIVIIIGGVEYMTSDVINNKESGKEKIRQALLGLLLAIASWLILNTINPDILKSDLNVESVGSSSPPPEFVGPPAP